MTASDEPEDAVGDGAFDEDLDSIEDLAELDDVEFDPESDEGDLEPSIDPSIDDELVDEDELAAEDTVIELSLSEVAEDEAAGEDEDDAPPVGVEDEDDALVRVVEDDDEEVEGLREGEFICSSCYLAKGPSQLADAKRQICVDCI